jgi:hypothetical protein
MIDKFESILCALLHEGNGGIPAFDPVRRFEDDRNDDAGIARTLNSAFLIMLAGKGHPTFDRAQAFLGEQSNSSQWGDVARFYLKGIRLVHDELRAIGKRGPALADRMNDLHEWLSKEENRQNAEETTERIWSVFFPEGAGIRSNKRPRVESLRKKRMVHITELTSDPIHDPTRQVLFTSNVLLTLPSASQSTDGLDEGVKQKLLQCSSEPQRHWYDHPIPIGVAPEQNEASYGLRGLERALESERGRGNMSDEARLTCVLSVSVTHNGLQNIAKPWLEEELKRAETLKNVDVYVFTEFDTERVIREVLAPAAERLLRREDASPSLGMFGVDGSYGKHYSFLKAIAAFWSVFIKPDLKATFKIDLDQVFPQKELIEQTGASAFEHLRTPLWGARGIDSCGQSVELGMIAGFVVNESDIDKSLFTPDVTFPDRPSSPDEFVFFSRLPQALSTEAEMMTRYTTDELDGRSTCLQRVHVLGGMNGILIESLRRHRPFTPSFIGRAEDQAYLLSMFPNTEERLANVHKDGLVMRHDKEAFAREAIESAYVGRLLGDYIRILYYSAYAKVLTDDVNRLKDAFDPFTGCFISKIPVSVVLLRFALKAASFYTDGQDHRGLEFITTGARRLTNALEFTRDDAVSLRQIYERERHGWDLYYDILTAVEEALGREDAFAMELLKTAKTIVADCAIRM